MSRSRQIFAVLLLAMAAGCAAATTAGGRAPRGRAIITEEELASNASLNVYDLIQRIRPEYLRPRPTQTYQGGNGITAPPPVVMVNGQHTGSIADLRQISASALAQVRYYSIEEAKRTFGMQYEGGAIELTYRDLSRPADNP